MRRILASAAFFVGSTIVLLFANGCGQDEGGRCQIDSDCASGLTCDNRETGNGVCRASNGGGSSAADAAAKQDASLLSGPEVESEAETAPAVDLASPVELGPELDAGTVADGGAALPSDGQAIDSL